MEKQQQATDGYADKTWYGQRNNSRSLTLHFCIYNYGIVHFPRSHSIFGCVENTQHEKMIVAAAANQLIR